jgi:hypothetical protein
MMAMLRSFMGDRAFARSGHPDARGAGCPLERGDDGNATARRVKAAFSRPIVRRNTRKAGEREGATFEFAAATPWRLVISRFDNQRANSEKANENKTQ